MKVRLSLVGWWHGLKVPGIHLVQDSEAVAVFGVHCSIRPPVYLKLDWWWTYKEPYVVASIYIQFLALLSLLGNSRRLYHALISLKSSAVLYSLLGLIWSISYPFGTSPFGIFKWVSSWVRVVWVCLRQYSSDTVCLTILFIMDRAFTLFLNSSSLPHLALFILCWSMDCSVSEIGASWVESSTTEINDLDVALPMDVYLLRVSILPHSWIIKGSGLGCTILFIA